MTRKATPYLSVEIGLLEPGAGWIAVEERGPHQETVVERHLQAGAKTGFRIVRTAARQVLGIQHRPAESAVDEQVGVFADNELLGGRELTETQADLVGQALLEPEIEQADGRRRLDIAHQHQVVEIGRAVLIAEDGVHAGVDFPARPADELLEIAVHDDAEAAVIAGALFHTT